MVTAQAGVPRVLVIGPSWVGDMMMAQSLFMAIRRADPDAAIDVTAPAWALGVLSRMPQVREALPMPFAHGEARLLDRWRFGRALKGRYDRAYVLPGSWKSAVVPFAAGIPERFGYFKEWRVGLLNRIAPLPKAMKRRTAATYQALADPAVFEEADRQLRPALTVDEARQAGLLQQHGLEKGRYAALMPGAEFGTAKRWPPRHYAALAEMLWARGFRSVLMGSAKDKPVAEEIRALVPEAVDLTGATSLTDAIDIAAGAAFAVSNDSGLMHIAAAVGVPVVGVYGATSPEHTPPLTPRREALLLGLECAPCGKRQCPLHHHDCMEKLEPGLVMAALSRLGAL